MLDHIQRLQLAQIVEKIENTAQTAEPSKKVFGRDVTRIADYIKDAATVEAFRQKLTVNQRIPEKTLSERDISKAEIVVECLSTGTSSRAQDTKSKLELGSPHTVGVILQSFRNLRDVQNALQRAYIDDPDPSPEATDRLKSYISAVTKFEELLAAIESPTAHSSQKATRVPKNRSEEERFQTLIKRLGNNSSLNELQSAVIDYYQMYRNAERTSARDPAQLGQEASKKIALISVLVSDIWSKDPDPNERAALEELHAFFSQHFKSQDIGSVQFSH